MLFSDSSLIGQRFGKWTVLSFKFRDEKSEQVYECKCECGTIKDHRLSTLKRNITTQCKSCRMKQLNYVEDLVGKRFGNWIALEKIKNESRNEWYYKSICSCGHIASLSGDRLKTKKETNCHRHSNKIHGMYNTSTFKIWCGMLNRCFKPSTIGYKYYGGRGITVCERWKYFPNFLEDMGVRPDNLQIDRINNDGNYEPGNCRWATPLQNVSNRRNSKNKGGN
jgi:hypothetical protein